MFVAPACSKGAAPVGRSLGGNPLAPRGTRPRAAGHSLAEGGGPPLANQGLAPQPVGRRARSLPTTGFLGVRRLYTANTAEQSPGEVIPIQDSLGVPQQAHRRAPVPR